MKPDSQFLTFAWVGVYDPVIASGTHPLSVQKRAIIQRHRGCMCAVSW